MSARFEEAERAVADFEQACHHYREPVTGFDRISRFVIALLTGD